jgi:hypothetical protein
MNCSNRGQLILADGAMGAGAGAVTMAIVGRPVLAGAAVGAVRGAVIGVVTSPQHH